MILRYASLLAVLCAFVLGCGSRDPDEIRVFAASSLTDVMGTIARDYEAATGTRVRLNLAASSTLARQIVEGAPCDVFLSADEEWADFVEREGLVVPGSRRVVLTNSLVLVVPKASATTPIPSRVLTFAPPPPGPRQMMNPVGAFPASYLLLGLGDPALRSIAMGDPDHVPAGRYAKRALAREWDKISSKIVPCESVRAALALVARGEVDAAVVYETDARSEDRVIRAYCEVDSQEVLARYPAMEIRGGSPVACRFTYYLESPAARAVFEEAGFGFPERD